MTETAQPPAAADQGVDVTRLVAEAASKSNILWIEPPGDRAYPAWFVWHDDGDPRSQGPAVYVVSGPGEQNLPFLPEEVTLHFRSKDNGGLLLSIKARVAEVPMDTPEWDAAVEILKGNRLNSTGDVAAQWRAGGTIRTLHPTGRLLEGPGTYAATVRERVTTPAEGTTATWRPWHVGDRGKAIRNRKRAR